MMEGKLPLVDNDTESLATKFSNFFHDKIVTIQQSINQHDNSSLAFNNPGYSCTLLGNFTPFTIDEIQKLVKSSKQTSCELDPISTSVFLTYLEILLPTITSIINKSLMTGTVPALFKSAVVKPLLKKPSLDPNILKNYRPIRDVFYC
ncbi:hypothetical protein SNE40_002809 [Patella caerulea]|uniref:Reverse transcriptase domain-containing protein n=1 Tax=Patella caerulea TaxID=87958 RepID=A0AAN8QEJ9_PATCE